MEKVNEVLKTGSFLDDLNKNFGSMKVLVKNHDRKLIDDELFIIRMKEIINSLEKKFDKELKELLRKR